MLPVLIIAIETGMRRSELLSLTWADIDLHARVAHLRLSKNGDARDIPLLRRAVRTLEDLRSSPRGESVFPITANAVRLGFERIRTRAGCSDLRFHDLRREAITRFIERGLNIIEASYISGHRDVRMLSRYVAPQVESLIAKLDRIEA
jgi:integrase